MKRILVATDFSERSDRALRRATLLAKKFGASLSLVHVLTTERTTKLLEAERHAAVMLLGDLEQSLREVDGIACDSCLVQGVPSEEIIKVADASRADMVVVGPHRHEAIKDVFLGTTAELTIRASRRPVLEANGVPAAFYRHALVGVDFSACSADALHAVASLGLAEHVTVSVVHVFDAPARRHMALGSASKDEIEDYVAHEKGRAAQELAVFLRDVNFTPARQLLKVSQVSAAQTICATAHELSADLVVLGTQGRTGLAKFLLGSVAEEVLGRAATDVIAVPPRQ